MLTGIASGSVEGRTLLAVQGDNTVWGAGNNIDWNLGGDPSSEPYVVSFISKVFERIPDINTLQTIPKSMISAIFFVSKLLSPFPRISNNVSSPTI